MAKTAKEISGELRRGDVMKLLRCSRTQVIRLEQSGALHPRVDVAGVHWFRATEVEVLAMERAAKRSRSRNAPRPELKPHDKTAAEVFALFERARERNELGTEAGRRATLASIVRSCGVRPGYVLGLWRDYQRGLPDLAKEEAEREQLDEERRRAREDRTRRAREYAEARLELERRKTAAAEVANANERERLALAKSGGAGESSTSNPGPPRAPFERRRA